jgi:hypothetical protein
MRQTVFAALALTCCAGAASASQTADPKVYIEPADTQGTAFIARGAGYGVYFGEHDVTFTLRPGSPEEAAQAPPGQLTRQVRMVFPLGETSIQKPLEPLAGKTNYLLGSDQAQWRTNVPRFRRLRYEGAFPGVAVEFYGTDDGRLEFDFVLSPKAEASVIHVAFEGAQTVVDATTGDLVVKVDGRELLRQHRPVAYQTDATGSRKPVDASFAVAPDGKVGMRVGDYDRARELVIDPKITHSTYLGGTARGFNELDTVYGTAVDGDGNSYVAGMTTAIYTEFPTAGGLPSAQQSTTAYYHGFITKLTPSGQIIFSTYLGGVSTGLFGLAVDKQQRVYVVGTSVSGYPAVNAYMPQLITRFGESAVLSVLSATGDALLYSSYLGGTRSACCPDFTDDIAYGVAVDDNGFAYVVGTTYSIDFPTPNGELTQKPGNYSGFLVKVDPSKAGMESLLYGTYVGGAGDTRVNRVAVERTGGITYLVGNTRSAGLQTEDGISDDGASLGAFLAKYDAFGKRSYFNYRGWIATDTLNAVSVYSPGVVDAVGRVDKQAYWAKFDLRLEGQGKLLHKGTILPTPELGTPADSSATGVGVDGSGVVYIVGGVVSNTVFWGWPDPATSTWSEGGYLGTSVHGANDAFVRRYPYSDPGPAPRYPADASHFGFIGGSGHDNASDIAVTPEGEVVIGGTTFSQDFPIVAPVNAASAVRRGSSDAFVTRLAAAEGGLKILRSTTRWRPQRDPLADPTSSYAPKPIKIEFTGPDDLEITTPARVEITGPAGPIVGTAPIVSSSPTGPFTYVAEWSGPFTWADPNDLDGAGNPKLKPLPANNYPFVLKATRGTVPDQEEIASPTYGNLSFVEVKSVELVQCSSTPSVSCPDGGAVVSDNVRPTTGEAMPGGGKAAFPDADAPGGGYRKSLLVKAKLEPDLGDDASEVRVFFSWVDVDDPSAGRSTQDQPIKDPIDDDTVAVADNRTETAPLITPAMASPVEAGSAISAFQVSTTQGNNYRVAASTMQSWLVGIEKVLSSKSGQVTHNSGELVLDETGQKGPQVSEMLTVWRTLHVERLKMDPTLNLFSQRNLQYAGTATRVRGSRVEDSEAAIAAIDVFDHRRDSDWDGALFKVPAPKPTDIDPLPEHADEQTTFTAEKASSSPTKNAQTFKTTVTLATNVPSSAEGHPFILRDDEIAALTDYPVDDSAAGLAQFDTLRSLLATAYIDLSVEPITGNESVPFVHYLAPDDLRTYSGASSSDAYWNIPILIGFEVATLNQNRVAFGAQSDHDPTGESSSSGLSKGRRSDLRQPIAAMWVESIRDFHATEDRWDYKPSVGVNDHYSATVAHEVMHSLAGLDHDGGIMCALREVTAKDPWHHKLTLDQTAAVRATPRPDLKKDSSLDRSCSGSANTWITTDINCCYAKIPRYLQAR